MDNEDVANASDDELRRLLAFALERDPAGPRLKLDPPKDRKEILQQLYWLGVLS